MEKLKVLVVDDTIVYRKIVGDVLKAIPGVEVVGTANNGKIALSKISSLKPDLITLDIEMPEMNGIEVLQELHKHPSPQNHILLREYKTQLFFNTISNFVKFFNACFSCINQI